MPSYCPPCGLIRALELEGQQRALGRTQPQSSDDARSRSHQMTHGWLGARQLIGATDYKPAKLQSSIAFLYSSVGQSVRGCFDFCVLTARPSVSGKRPPPRPPRLPKMPLAAQFGIEPSRQRSGLAPRANRPQNGTSPFGIEPKSRHPKCFSIRDRTEEPSPKILFSL